MIILIKGISFSNRPTSKLYFNNGNTRSLRVPTHNCFGTVRCRKSNRVPALNYFGCVSANGKVYVKPLFI